MTTLSNTRLLLLGCRQCFQLRMPASQTDLGFLKQRSFSSQSNIDEDEVRKFEKVAREWWDPNGSLKGLLSMNALRVPFIRDGLLKTKRQSVTESGKQINSLQGFKILDVGCGGGLLCEPLARLGADVTGIDPVEESIRVALTHALQDPDFQDNLTYSCTTVDSLFPDYANHFDAVVASEVIEHVPDSFAFAKACAALVKPGGSFFLTTLNKTRLSWLLAIVAAENVLGILPRGTHDWEKFVSPEEVARVLETVGCRVAKVHGMFYTPVIDKWDWQESTAVNYALHAVK